MSTKDTFIEIGGEWFRKLSDDEIKEKYLADMNVLATVADEWLQECWNEAKVVWDGANWGHVFWPDNNVIDKRVLDFVGYPDTVWWLPSVTQVRLQTEVSLKLAISITLVDAHYLKLQSFPGSVDPST